MGRCWGRHVVILLFTSFILRSFTSGDKAVVDCILKDCKDAEVRCVLKAQEDIFKWLQINNKYNVLAVGKTGTGKTRLIKGFAKNITNVSETNDINLFPKTLKVESFRYTHEGSKIILYDSPGLVDTEGGDEGTKKNHEYLMDMVRNVPSDVVIFFIRMDQFQKHLDEEDERVIRTISDTFGSTNWRYTMFVLSFANKVHSGDAKEQGDEDDQYHFTLKQAQMSFQIKKLLRTLRVDKDVIKDIPIVPVGLVGEEKFVADIRDISWVKEFWSNLFKILERIRKDKRSAMKPEKEEDFVKDHHGSSWWNIFWFWK